MKNLFQNKIKYFLVLALAIGFSIACNPTTTNTNTNTVTNTNTTSNSNTTNVNSTTNSNSEVSASIEAEEPNKYQATVSLNVETKGDNKAQTPKIQADVARDGENRRMELTMPNGEKIIYLTIGEKQFIIAPARKQYAELNKETLGIEVRKMLTPDQIVNQVKEFQGVKRSGEEKYNGRDVTKYTFDATTDTKTKAGEVETESFVLVDKETNLPIRSVIDTQSKSGEVQGVSGLKVITEISNIKTEVDETLFEEPKDFEKVEAEVVRGQLKAFFDTAQLVLGQLLKASQPAN